jgi:Tfp pilus assembly protein PilN
MKLPRRKSQASAMPNWHPNFRNAATLPDLKVIRTSFFVNLLCVTLGVAAFLFTVYREYLAFSIRGEIQEAERRIENASARNNKLLALNREFQEGANKFAEVKEFTSAPLQASSLLVALSRSLPEYMDFTSVLYEGRQLTLRGTIRGTSDTASARVQAYSDVLRQDEILGPHFPDVSVAKLDRDGRTQGLTFEILLKPPAPPPPKPKAGNP